MIHRREDPRRYQEPRFSEKDQLLLRLEEEVAALRMRARTSRASEYLHYRARLEQNIIRLGKQKADIHDAFRQGLEAKLQEAQLLSLEKGKVIQEREVLARKYAEMKECLKRDDKALLELGQLVPELEQRILESQQWAEELNNTTQQGTSFICLQKEEINKQRTQLALLQKAVLGVESKNRSALEKMCESAAKGRDLDLRNDSLQKHRSQVAAELQAKTKLLNCKMEENLKFREIIELTEQKIRQLKIYLTKTGECGREKVKAVGNILAWIQQNQGVAQSLEGQLAESEAQRLRWQEEEDWSANNEDMARFESSKLQNRLNSLGQLQRTLRQGNEALVALAERQAREDQEAIKLFVRGERVKSMRWKLEGREGREGKEQRKELRQRSSHGAGTGRRSRPQF